jgi:hypothetical protein
VIKRRGLSAKRYAGPDKIEYRAKKIDMPLKLRKIFKELSALISGTFL